MKLFKLMLASLFMTLLPVSCTEKIQDEPALQKKNMMVRIAELEIAPEYLVEYIEILKEESETSVLLEPGVISIFPMYLKDSKSSVRILEIYKNQEAYQAHLETSHFIKYKKSTKKMVKGLKLIDLNAIDSDNMPEIFSKLE